MVFIRDRRVNVFQRNKPKHITRPCTLGQGSVTDAKVQSLRISNELRGNDDDQDPVGPGQWL